VRALLSSSPSDSPARLAALLVGLPSSAALAAATKSAPPSVAISAASTRSTPSDRRGAARLSWELVSAERGVVQSAYQLQVTRAGRRSGHRKGRFRPFRPRPLRRPALESSAGTPGACACGTGPGGPRRGAPRLVGDGAPEAGGLEGPLDRDRGERGHEDLAARTDAAGRLHREGQGAIGPRLRDEPRLYELEINGRRVGDQVFTPGWTSYGKRLQYQAYDVTSLLRDGPTRSGHARGWLVPRQPRLQEAAQPLRREPGAPVQLRIEARTAGPGRRHRRDLEVRDRPRPDVRHLQRRDLRRAARAAGWSTAGYDDKDWVPVKVAEPAKRALVAPPGPRSAGSRRSGRSRS